MKTELCPACGLWWAGIHVCPSSTSGGFDPALSCGHEAEIARLHKIEEAARYARAVATIWRDAYLKNHCERRGEVQWAIGTHPLALVLAALDGETEADQLGCDEDTLCATLEEPTGRLPSRRRTFDTHVAALEGGRPRRCPMTPMTEAGKRLLAALVKPRCSGGADWLPAFTQQITAIETEAAHAALARIRERVEGLPRYIGTERHPYGASVKHAAILAILDEEAAR